MPVNPRTTDTFVNGSNLVDVIISRIDDILSSSEEKYYRHGSDDDYYYTFAFAVGSLSEDEMAVMKQAYTEVGWAVVQVRNLEGPGDAKAVWIRIFRKADSSFFRWS